MKYAQGSTFSTIVDYGKSVWAYTDDSASFETIPDNTAEGTATGTIDRTDGTVKFGPFYKPTVVKITATSGELDVRNYEFSVTTQTDNEFNEMMTATNGMTPGEIGNYMSALKSFLDYNMPQTPVLTFSDVTDTSVVLTWTDPSSAGSFLIYQDDVQIGTSSILSEEITGLDAGSSYNFYVVAVNNGVQSAPSNIVTVATSQPLLSASQQNSYGRYIKDYSGTYDKLVFEENHYVGSGDLNEIVFGFDTVFMPQNSDRILDDVGQSLTIEKASVQIGSVTVPLLFSGSRTVVIPDGVINYLSDPLVPADFGLSTFAYDSNITVRVLINQGQTTNITAISAKDTRTYNGTSIWFNSSDTSVSDIDINGTPVVSGPTKSSRIESPSARLIGRYSSSGAVSLCGRGDSITQGVGDSTTVSRGSGWLHRATQLFVTKPSCLNLASSGSVSFAGIDDTRLSALYELCTDGVIAYGANDIGLSGTGDNVALLANVNTIEQQMRDAGMSTVGVMELIPRTSSTDLWATEENQSYVAGWGAGGNADLYNVAIQSESFDYIIPMDSIRGIDQFNWLTNGTAGYTSQDGTHPSSGGHSLMASEASSVMAGYVTGLDV